MINMKFLIILALAISVLQQSINGQKTSTTTTPKPTTTPKWTDPHTGGKLGNPGANIHLSSKALDQLHAFVADQLARRIKLMNMSDFDVSLGSTKLYIKSPRFTESKFGKYEMQFVPTNRIDSKFFDGKFVIDGDWQYKPPKRYRATQEAMNGTFKATVVNAELESVAKLSKNNKNMPIVEITECKSNFSEYKVEIKGAGDLTMVEKCDKSYESTCTAIRKHVEDEMCKEFRAFMKDEIDARLATFPAMIELSKDFKINYGLLSNQPKVTDNDIQAGLEGKAIWYGQSSVPFNPQQLDFDNRTSMLMFELSDYTFNTLLHQPHAQGYKYSAAELLSNSPSINDSLLLNCSMPTKCGPNNRGCRTGHHRAGVGRSITGSCLGSILSNISNFDEQQLGTLGDIGDLVFKSTTRAPTIMVSKSPSRTRTSAAITKRYRANKNNKCAYYNSYGDCCECSGYCCFYEGGYAYCGYWGDLRHRHFDGSNGVLEIYGQAVGQQQQGKLLAKADIKSMIGEFTPKLNKNNITGSVKINELKLSQSATHRSIDNDWLVKLEEFAKPLLTDMFNAFLERYAQFPIPMLDGFECTSPELSIMVRTMQVSCDVRAITSDQFKKPGGASRCYGFYDTSGNYYYYDCNSQCIYSYSGSYWLCNCTFNSASNTWTCTTDGSAPVPTTPSSSAGSQSTGKPSQPLRVYKIRSN